MLPKPFTKATAVRARPHHIEAKPRRSTKKGKVRLLVLTRQMLTQAVVPVDKGGGTDTFAHAFIDLADRMQNLQLDIVALEPPARNLADTAKVRMHYFKASRLHDLLWTFREGRNPLANAVLLFAMAWAMLRTALRLTRSHQYDAVYAIGGPIAGLAGIALKTLAGLPLIMHFQYTYHFRSAAPAVRALAAAFYRRADALIGNCKMLGTDATAIGMPASRCFAISNWVDQEVFRPLPDRPAKRAKWNVPADATAFFFGGRFCPTKHVDRLIDALHGLRTPGMVFLFAGEGVLEPELRRIAAANPAIRLLGTRTRDDLVELHNACDVQFWGSVDVDYPGLVIMEAMSSGLPVVTSDETMNTLYPGEKIDPAMIGAPRYARLYPPTREGIRQAIRESVERRAELLELRPEVRAFAQRRFGFANALQLLDVIAQTAGCERPRALARATFSASQ